MTYGFKVYNSNSEVVLDETSPVYVVEKRETLAGASTGLTDGNGDPIYKWTLPTTNELMFFKLPAVVDAFFGRGARNLIGIHGWWSTLSSVDIIRLREVSSKADGTGYGVNVFDSSGDLTYTANEETFVIGDILSLSFDQTAQPNTDEWFCIPNSWEGVVEVDGGTLHYRGTGVKWATTTTIKSMESGGPTIEPEPFLVMTG